MNLAKEWHTLPRPCGKARKITSHPKSLILSISGSINFRPLPENLGKTSPISFHEYPREVIKDISL